MSSYRHWPASAAAARGVVTFLAAQHTRESFAALCMLDYAAKNDRRRPKACSPAAMRKLMRSIVPAWIYDRISAAHDLKALERDENAVFRIGKGLWGRSSCSNVTMQVSDFLKRDDACEEESELYECLTGTRNHEAGRSFASDRAIGDPMAVAPMSVDELIATTIVAVRRGKYVVSAESMRSDIARRLRVGDEPEAQLAAVAGLTQDMDRLSAAQELIRALHNTTGDLRLCVGGAEDTLVGNREDPESFREEFPVDVIQGWIAIFALGAEGGGDEVFHRIQDLRRERPDTFLEDIGSELCTEFVDEIRETFLYNRASWCDEDDEYDPWCGESPADDDQNFSDPEVMQYYAVDYPVRGYLTRAGELVVDTSTWGALWCRQAYGQHVYCDGWATTAVRELASDESNREHIYHLLYWQ